MATTMKLSVKDCLSAIKTCFKKYATFKGRASRSEHWYFIAFNICIFALLAFAFWQNGGKAGGDFLYQMSKMWFLSTFLSCIFTSPLNILSWVLSLLPTIAVSIRRMHDTGKSGWWILTWWGAWIVSCCVPGIDFIIIPVGTIWYCILTLEKGQPGENKYGPNPKGVDAPISDNSTNTTSTVEPINPSAIETSSSAAQLIELKQLLDAGILTQEEFDAKKKQLLDL